MKVFRFKQFEVQQDKAVFRVGTDAVLLGVLCEVQQRKKILEVGTGTGIISLMLAQRSLEAQFLALDIDSNAVELASQNFKNSPFGDRMKVIERDFNKFEHDQKFDLIVSNPPYFEISDSEKDKKARQMLLLNFEQLVSKSSLLLEEKGLLSLVLPYDVTEKLNSIALQNNLFLVRKVNIAGIEGGELKRVVLEYAKTKTQLLEEYFVVESSPRVYSPQYMEATKDFHIFKYN